MAFPAWSYGRLVLSVKVVLISTGLLSAAVILKHFVPSVTELAASDLPVVYSSILSWLRPPYLYFVINFIIISIVASSKLQHQKTDQPFTTVVVTSANVKSFDYDVPAKYVEDGYSYGSDMEEVAAKAVVEERVFIAEDMTVLDGGELVSNRMAGAPQRSDSMEFSADKEDTSKPLISARFGRRKAITEGGKTSTLGLGVSKPRKHDTMESTWKTITDGRSMPLTRHLKKSDTWNTLLGHEDANVLPPPPLAASQMKKSETFSENKSSSKNKKLINQRQQGPGTLRRESSLSQDELNRRVEAFINKFNEEMRLQRQESLNQFHEMIRRGA
ncbi:hypothetical protein K2173_010779 [Erythroxylum novogranatense]|uniref:DUF4408 domain-containing protein n=1 Tax=Erythroxylum novogranatense TaxID=1862640 RepID=A0AAV8SRJ7_9ROSI|nr:hypothetical protein K2173_010779 [Erythroxylum novogranatense]